MCQNYGQSDATLDLIIKRTSLLTAQLPVRCRGIRDRVLKTRLASDLMENMSERVRKWTHTRVRLDGVDDCA